MLFISSQLSERSIMTIDYDKYRMYRVDLVPVRHRKKDLYKLNIGLDGQYRAMIAGIREMDRRLRGFILTFDDYRELVQRAHAVNVHWSTRLEGNRMSLEQVEESSRLVSTSRSVVREMDPGDRQEVLNHLYSYFMRDDMKLPWTLDVVSQVHLALMSGAGADCVPGMIRRDAEDDMCVEAGGQEVFIGCPSVDVAGELTDLLDWIERSPYDPMLTAIVFFHEFESIHPFTEGNGRTGRSMFHVLMQELGFRSFGLCTVEDKLLGDAPVYYELLRYTDKTGDYSPLARFFIDCIHAAYEEAVSVFGEKDVLKDLDPNSRELAVRARGTQDWFSLRDAAGWIGGMSDQSVRIRLNRLADMGVLEKAGRTRATRYRFDDPFRSVKEALAEQEGSEREASEGRAGGTAGCPDP